MVFPNFRPSDLVDKLLTLFLRIVLAILLKILYIIKGEDVRVTKVEVTIKKANEEKRYTHIIDTSKEREINQKELINNQKKVEEETKTELNLVTGTPSELEPEEIIKDEIINNEDEELKASSDSIIESSSDKRDHLKIGCPIEIKTSHNNNNESDILPIEFHWKHGGQEVFITGDFDNWQGTNKMGFNPITQDFVAVVDIDRTKQHKFKFIVDGEWKPNWDLPTSTDEHGNVNNIIYSFPSGPLSPEYKEYANSSQLAAY